MKALLLGLFFFALALLAAVNWWIDILAFLRGGLPVIAFFVGLVALFIGIADLRDRAAAKKETKDRAA
jgi:hypothetical protein